MTTTISPADFMAAAPAPIGGSSPWASRYATEFRRVVREHAARQPRSLQTFLGPSELGARCDRQVVGKFAGEPETNHVVDPWASVIGTAVHAWLADAFVADNHRHGVLRWVAEQQVTPHPDHPGKADLYDAVERAVADHKILGESSMAKVRSSEGPPRRYKVQLLLYALGYRNLGLPVDHIALVAYPRTSHTLDGLYVWEHVPGPEDDQLLEEVLTRTETRKQLATEVRAGRMELSDIPRKAEDDECFFCPFYRPQSAHDGGSGCPGTIA